LFQEIYKTSICEERKDNNFSKKGTDFITTEKMKEIFKPLSTKIIKIIIRNLLLVVF